MKILYADEYLLTNLAMNYLCLTAAAALSGVYSARGRIALSALLGAVYALGAQLIGGALRFIPLQFSMLALMVWLAHPKRQGYGRFLIVCFGINCALAGVLLAAGQMTGCVLRTESGYLLLHIPMRLVLAGALGCWFLSGLVLKGSAKQLVHGKTFIVSVLFQSRKTTLRLFVDTGNDLIDPVSGKPVCVVRTEALLQLFSSETAHILLSLAQSDAESILRTLPDALLPRFRLIPYRAVGTAHGLMLCFRPDAVRDAQQNTLDVLIGLCPWQLESGFDGLIGNELI